MFVVINSNKDIVGRFLDKKRAFNYMVDYWFDNCDDKVIMKEMTAEEYTDYTKKLINRYK